MSICTIDVGKNTKRNFIFRSLKKLTQLIDDQMESINCQKVLMPSLTPGDLWVATRRWEEMGAELLKVDDRHGRHFVFSPTHEEAITSLVAGLFPVSHRGLPIKIYQVSNKFRDEMRPRFGLIRSREFIMKDLYTFDRDLESAARTYEEVTGAYVDFFTELGVSFVRVRGDTGAIGGSVSHEFHFDVGGIGEDRLFTCPKCLRAENAAVMKSEDRFLDCEECGGAIKLAESHGVEVGHTFLLGDRYSAILKGQYLNEEGRPDILQMGCYGLGVSRILAASVEALSPEGDLRWPPHIVPFTACILVPKPGSREEAAGGSAMAIDFYDALNSDVFPQDVALDDRDRMTVGRKLREARKTGYRFIVLFGKGCLDPSGPQVEVHEVGDANEWEMTELTPEEAMDYLRTRSIS